MTHFVIITLCLAALAAASNDAVDAPGAIAKVVKLLESMKGQVAKDAEADQEAYDKYKCFCETNMKQKTDATEGAGNKVDELMATITTCIATQGALKADIESLSSDIEEAKASLAEAAALRRRGAAAFSATKAELTEAITGLTQAVAALSKVQLLQKNGHSLSSPKVRVLLLQAQDTLKGIHNKQPDLFRNVMQKDFFDVMGTLGGSASGMFLHRGSALAQQKRHAAPGAARSAEIYGMLKGMLDDFKSDLAEAEKSEKDAITIFLKLKAAKEGEIMAAQAQLDAKQAALSAQGTAAAHAREDLASTKAAKAADDQFERILAANCKKADVEFAARVQARDEETLALAETLKILTGDAAQQLFTKSLSFLQVHGGAVADSATAKNMNKAMERIMQTAKKHANWLLASLAVRMKLDPFVKVKAMMDKMMKDLQAAQAAEFSKNEFCLKSVRDAEGEIKVATSEKDDLTVLKGKLAGEISLFESEIAKLKQEVSENEISLKQAEEDRKAESLAYQQAVTDQRATVKVLTMAYERLKSFYAPGVASLTQVSPPVDRPLVGGCAGVLCPASCPDGSTPRQVGNECCSCGEAKPLVGGCAGVLCPASCADGSTPTQVGNDCCSCGKPLVGGCAGVLCPASCADGTPPQQVGDACCVCQATRPVVGGCPGVLCAGSCADGSAPKQVGNECCVCQETRPLKGGCASVLCPASCPDGSTPQQVGNDCCSCSRPLVGGCAGVMCPASCPDGSTPQQVGNDCCSCGKPIVGGDPAVWGPGNQPKPEPIVYKPMPSNNYAAQASGGGALQMIATIISDAQAAEATLDADEQKAQLDYAQLAAATQASIEADNEAMLEKSKLVEKAMGNSAETAASLIATEEKLTGLGQTLAAHHTACDWLVKYFDVRQTARKEEMDAIDEAKAILSGARFGDVLLQ